VAKGLNRTKVELKQSHAGAYECCLTEFESNQSGIETFSLTASFVTGALFESNQSGIETVLLNVVSKGLYHV